VREAAIASRVLKYSFTWQPEGGLIRLRGDFLHPGILSMEEAILRFGRQKRNGRRIVFTNGCFDLLHVGHVTYLQEAAAYGDRLVVAVNSDTCVKRLKGANRPVITEHDRAAMLAALACVDYVVVFEEDTPKPLLMTLRPDVLVKGGIDMPRARHVTVAFPRIRGGPGCQEVHLVVGRQVRIGRDIARRQQR